MRNTAVILLALTGTGLLAVRSRRRMQRDEPQLRAQTAERLRTTAS